MNEIVETPSEVKEEGSSLSCLMMLALWAFGPWAVSILVSLTPWPGEALGWLLGQSPVSTGWSAFFVIAMVLLAGSLLTAPLRLTHSEGGRYISEPYLVAAFFDMLLVFVIANAAMHEASGLNAGEAYLFYSSSGVLGKLFITPVIAIAQLLLCAWAAGLGARCFLKLSGITIDNEAEIMEGRSQEPWLDRVRRHTNIGNGWGTPTADLFVYVPALITLVIVQRANPFVLSILLCLLLVRMLLIAPLEFISTWFDLRADRLTRRLCEELVDPPHVHSRLTAITKLAAMKCGPLSGQEQVASVLEDPDPAVAQAAATVMEKIDNAKAMRADALIDVGKQLAEKKSFSPAVKVYTRALEFYPQSHTAYYYRGLAYEGESERDLAIADFTEAIGLSPENANFYNDRGLTYFNNDDFELAIKDYTEAIRLNPKDPLAYIRRSEAHAATDAVSKAWADIKHYRKLGGGDEPEFITRLHKKSQRET
ncbi:MAG: tetratricopeptide repeat protein [Phycisphaerales bacterium]|jgi:hypothetical protein|nr:tetratricopeptide repeat protein [Phycisphaerales bacterium]